MPGKLGGNTVFLRDSCVVGAEVVVVVGAEVVVVVVGGGGAAVGAYVTGRACVVSVPRFNGSSVIQPLRLRLLFRRILASENRLNRISCRTRSSTSKLVE